MDSFQKPFHLLVVFLCFSLDPINMWELPICSVYNAICEISFNKSSTPSSDHTERFCSCPGNVACKDLNRTLMLELTSAEDTTAASISYCEELGILEHPCKKSEIAATFIYVGPDPNDIVWDINCYCSEPLELVKIMPDNWVSHRHFACGKPTCDVCNSDPPACETKTIIDDGVEKVHATEQPCRCPYGYSCDVNEFMQPVYGEVLKFFCKPT